MLHSNAALSMSSPTPNILLAAKNVRDDILIFLESRIFYGVFNALTTPDDVKQELKGTS